MNHRGTAVGSSVLPHPAPGPGDKAEQDARFHYPGWELDVTVSIPTGTTVGGEPAALRPILANLIGNSVHHAAGSTLRIEGDARSILGR